MRGAEEPLPPSPAVAAAGRWAARMAHTSQKLVRAAGTGYKASSEGPGGAVSPCPFVSLCIRSCPFNTRSQRFSGSPDGWETKTLGCPAAVWGGWKPMRITNRERLALGGLETSDGRDLAARNLNRSTTIHPPRSAIIRYCRWPQSVPIHSRTARLSCQQLVKVPLIDTQHWRRGGGEQWRS